MRSPSPLQALQVVSKCLKSPIETVIDIGVGVGTDFLVSAFPAAHHILFEPVVVYHEMIRQHYSEKNISHTLVASAVSDSTGLMYQHLLSPDMSGRVTHSQLLPCPDPTRFGSKLIEIVETPVVSLDDWSRNNNFRTGYAVKIDVDGIEDKIIAGGQVAIAGAVILIVETHLAAISRRVKSLEDLGMKLFDIVGHGYYLGQLHQVDLVFVADRVVKDDLDFQPWKKTGKIIWEEWQQLS